MASSGRKQQAAAAVMVVVVAAMLVAAAEADCGVSSGTLNACLSYCTSGGNSDACCGPVRSADFNCLCRNYWNKLKSVPFYANCVGKVKSACGISKSC